MKRWKLITGVLFVFMVGVLVGSLGTNIYVKKRYFGLRHSSAERTAFIVDRLTERLNLTEDQKSKVTHIVQDMGKKAEEIFRRHREEMHQFMEKNMEKVKEVLTPDQQKELDRMRAEFEERRKKRPRGFPSGKHGPPPGEPGPPPGEYARPPF